MKTVKIYISSTFKDMNAERDVLIKGVFPRLKEKAEKELGVRVQEVDLRWGVTEEEVKKGNVVDICLSGIDECRPYFLCMLGKRYGWIPAPAYVNIDDIESVFERAPAPEKAVLQKAYGKADERGYSLDLNLTDEEKEQVRQLLEKYGVKAAGQSITEQEIEQVIGANSVPGHIKELNKLFIGQESKISQDDADFALSMYSRQGSDIWFLKKGTTDPEKVRLRHIFEAMDVPLGYHSFFFIREDCGETGDDFVETPGSEKEKKLRDLKSRIEREKDRFDGYARYKCEWDPCPSDDRHHIYGLAEFENLVEAKLWAHLIKNPELKNAQPNKTGLALEEELQMRFADSRTYNFCGRTAFLAELKNKITLALDGKLLSAKAEKPTGYVLLTGVPGSGKSAVMAKLFMILREKPEYSGAIIIGRFVGATGRSTSPRNIVSDICETLKERCGIPDAIPFDYNELKAAFADFLNKANRPVIIFIDAANQLRKEAHDLAAWLPRVLPAGVCIVISALDKEKNKAEADDIDVLEKLRHWSNPPHEMRLISLNDDEKREIINNYLAQYNKKLNNDQNNTIIGQKESGLPLFLQVALEELRMVSRYEDLPNYFSGILQDNTEDIFEQVLIRAEKDLEQAMPGQGRQLSVDFVKYIAAGRNGMTEEDLRLLLGDWQKLDRELTLEERNRTINEIKLDEYRWGELKRSIGSYLFQSGDEWNFFHDQLKQAVGRRYLHEEYYKIQVHSNIADYLERMGYEHSTTAKYLPYHLENADRIDDLREVLLTFKWMFEKLKAANVNELIADYSLLDEREIRLIKDAIILSAHILSQDIKQLPSQMYGRLLSFLNDARIGTLLSQIAQWKDFVWLKPINVCLQRPGESLIRTLAGHTDVVNGVSITPDGKKAVSASYDGTLKVWDIGSGKELRTLTGHTREVAGVKITPDGKKAVSVSWDETLKVWDLESGEELRTINSYFSMFSGVCITPDGKIAVSASRDETLKVWDLESGKELRTINSYLNPFSGACVTPDGTKLVSASDNGTLKVWVLESGEELRMLTGHKGGVNAVSITPDGKKAVSASDDETLKVWDIESGKELKTLVGHTGRVEGLCITPDGMKAVSASWDKTLKVWDLESGRELRTLTGHNEVVAGVSITPDGKKAVSTSYDQTLKVWDLESEKKQGMLAGHTAAVYELSITPDGKKAVSASKDKTLKVWDLESGKELLTLIGHTGAVYGVSITPDGWKAVSASKDETLKVWDILSGWEMKTLIGHTGGFTAVSIIPDGKKAVSVSWDETLKVWDLESGKELKTLTGHTCWIYGVSITPDGKKAVSVSKDETLRVWDIESGQELRTLTGHSDYVYVISITSDGKKAVSASKDKTLIVWDIESGEELRTLTGHTDWVTGVCITPDGKKAVSASKDHTLKVWDLESGKELRTLIGHTDWVNWVCITQDEKKTVSVSDDGSLIVWDIKTGKINCSFFCDTDFYTNSINLNGNRIIAGNSWGVVCILEFQGTD